MTVSDQDLDIQKQLTSPANNPQPIDIEESPELPSEAASNEEVPESSTPEITSDDQKITIETEYPVDEIVKIKKNQDTLPFDVHVSQESTRSGIAWIFTICFLLLISIGVTIPFIIKAFSPTTIDDPLNTAKELGTIIASILGGPFGFIVGFYFKQSDDN